MIHFVFDKNVPGLRTEGDDGKPVEAIGEWRQREDKCVELVFEDPRELRDEVEQHKEAYHGVCKTMARMHAAALGEVREPIRGVVEDIEDLRKEYEGANKTCEKLGDLLRGVANALKGEPEPLHLHSWHDLPSIAAQRMQELDELEAELARLRLDSASRLNEKDQVIADLKKPRDTTAEDCIRKITLLGDGFYLTYSNTLHKWILSVEDGKHGREWSDDELKGVLLKTMTATAHKGDPCEYCGENLHTIQPGPCPKNPMSPGNEYMIPEVRDLRQRLEDAQLEVTSLGVLNQQFEMAVTNLRARNEELEKKVKELTVGKEASDNRCIEAEREIVEIDVQRKQLLGLRAVAEEMISGTRERDTDHCREETSFINALTEAVSITSSDRLSRVGGEAYDALRAIRTLFRLGKSYAMRSEEPGRCVVEKLDDENRVLDHWYGSPIEAAIGAEKGKI